MRPASGSDAATIEVVVPVHDEARVLRDSIGRLHAYLEERFPFPWRITIVDNASTDGTEDVARALAADLAGVKVMRLERKGRGLALRSAWSQSDATVVAYMDVDLSTGLDALLPLVAPILSGHSDLAIGSRLAPGAAVARGPQRELISRCYNAILRAVFLNRFRDAQCGFKAVRGEIAHLLLPAIEDDGWFFDTELLLLAEHNGLRVHEVPVDWIDDPDSRVRVASTAAADLRGVLRMARTFVGGRGKVDLGAAARASLTDDLGRQFVGFAFVGVLSTIASLLAFLALRDPIGPIPANLVAVAGVGVVNTWANRRYTFGHRGRDDRSRQYLGVVASVLVGAAMSTALLAYVVVADGPLWAECAVLLIAWSLSALVRFALLRSWVFGARHAPRGVQRARSVASRDVRR